MDVLHGTPGGKLTGCARSKIKRVKLFGSSSIPGHVWLRSGSSGSVKYIQQTLQGNVYSAVWLLHIWKGMNSTNQFNYSDQLPFSSTSSPKCSAASSLQMAPTPFNGPGSLAILKS